MKDSQPLAIIGGYDMISKAFLQKAKKLIIILYLLI